MAKAADLTAWRALRAGSRFKFRVGNRTLVSLELDLRHGHELAFRQCDRNPQGTAQTALWERKSIEQIAKASLRNKELVYSGKVGLGPSRFSTDQHPFQT